MRFLVVMVVVLWYNYYPNYEDKKNEKPEIDMKSYHAHVGIKAIVFTHILIFLILWPVCSFARTITVDDSGGADFTTIQAAINDSNDGDIIEVHLGTYVENICFKGKNVILTSTDPNDPNIVENTIIDGNDANSVVTFAGSEDANCVLTGFTIRNGYKGEILYVDIQPEGGDTEPGWTAWDAEEWYDSINLSADFDYDFTATLEYGEPCDNGDWQTEYPPAPDCADAFEDGYVTFGVPFFELSFSNLAEGRYCIVTYHVDMEYEGDWDDPESTFYINDERYGETCGRNIGMGAMWLYFYSDGISDVVLSFELDEGPVIWLNGFALKASGHSVSGGGISGNGCSATISKCIIEDNQANCGGGIADCNGLINQNIIINNTASAQPPYFLIGIGGVGGGLYDCDGTISENQIAYNDTHFSGGAMIYCDGSILNNLVVNNSAIYCGGLSDCNGVIKNCTFVGNRGKALDRCPGTIQNCIVWNGSNPDNQVEDCNKLSYCCIENWTGGGIGNISTDPCFVNGGYWDNNQWVENNSDYHLQSQAGRWDPNTNKWLTDANTSACIDAGNPGCLLGDEPNDVNNVRINMGAYGGTAEASKSPAGWRSIADLTNDYLVDFNDLDVFVDYWLYNGQCIPSDLKRNGAVDFIDFSIFAGHWMEGF